MHLCLLPRVCLSLFTCLSLSLLLGFLSLLHHDSFFLNSLSTITRSVGSLSLFARKNLTCPESQSAPALAHSLNGASRRKNLYRCPVVCGNGGGCGGCCSGVWCCVWCGVLWCVVWSVVCGVVLCCMVFQDIWPPFKEIHGYTCRLPARV